MNDLRWTQVKTLFVEARELERDARPAFLDAECADDTELRQEVSSLLHADQSGGAFLDPPDPAHLSHSLDRSATMPQPGARLGPYRLVREVAEGGMGVVYLAERADRSFTKRVAIKVIHAHIATPHMRRRFQAERQTLASLDHPNITRLIDGGTTPNGLPFLVMEEVRGEAITSYCDARRLGLGARLALFRDVCAAVQYAHRNLVVHRDLKPSNIFVTDDGTVKLLDFGIARLLEDERTPAHGATVTSLNAHTPEYASPEQIRGEPATTSTDVYSLGAVLYELLTGVQPLALDSLARYEAERTICEIMPPRPSAVKAPPRSPVSLTSDLDTIVLTALQKEPERRYTSVEQFAEDLRREQAGLPILAQPDRIAYRARKFVRRNAPLVVAGGIALMAVLSAITGITLGLLEAQDAQRVAQEQRNDALRAQAETEDVLTFFEDTLARANPYQTGGDLKIEELLRDAEQRLNRGLVDQPRVEARVRLALARMYANMMRWDAVSRHASTATRLSKQIRGSDDLVVAEGLSLLGRALTHLGNPRALAYQQEALRIREAHFGASHPLVAESLGNLGFAMWASRVTDANWDGAEAHYRRAIAMMEELGLGASNDAARMTLSLGFMFHRRHQFADAEHFYRRALALYDQLPVASDHYEIATHGCLAELMEQTDRPAAAEAILRTVRSKMPSHLGPSQHAHYTWRIALALAAQGQPEEALEEFRTALALEFEHLASVSSTSEHFEAAIAAIAADDWSDRPEATAATIAALPTLRYTAAKRRGVQTYIAVLQDLGHDQLARRISTELRDEG